MCQRGECTSLTWQGGGCAEGPVGCGDVARGSSCAREADRHVRIIASRAPAVRIVASHALAVRIITCSEPSAASLTILLLKALPPVAQPAASIALTERIPALYQHRHSPVSATPLCSPSFDMGPHKHVAPDHLGGSPC